jgi:hypothetical protein
MVISLHALMRRPGNITAAWSITFCRSGERDGFDGFGAFNETPVGFPPRDGRQLSSLQGSALGVVYVSFCRIVFQDPSLKNIEQNYRVALDAFSAIPPNARETN